jgi:hypothetical protein
MCAESYKTYSNLARKPGLCCPLCVTVKAPGTGVECDATPSSTLLCGTHFRPQLHFFKGTATSLASLIALAGRANGNAGCVRSRLIPSLPRCQRFGRHAEFVCLSLVVVNEQGIHLGQGPCGGGQTHPVRRRLALPPEVDGGLYVGDVYACQRLCLGFFAGGASYTAISWRHLPVPDAPPCDSGPGFTPRSIRL